MISWIRRIYREWDCVMIHGKHVYDDGLWKPSFRCFWCDKKKPVSEKK